MLLELYPRVHRRYTSLAIIGPTLDGYGTWLLKQGYSTDRAGEYFRAAPRLAYQLEQRGVRTLVGITRVRLQSCAPADSQDDPDLAALVRQMDRYFRAELSLYSAPALTCIAQRVTAYTTYLQQVRGFARSTCTYHRRTVPEFLTHLGYEKAPTRLAALTSRDLETFLCAVGPRQTRASLQHVVSHIRAFLRFLVSSGEIPAGLDTQIDTPRVYRGEQLPRALPWETVQALLKAIERTTPMGRRDYAMFLLIATYGLRA
jgi:integrase/recombinase XerD